MTKILPTSVSGAEKLLMVKSIITAGGVGEQNFDNLLLLKTENNSLNLKVSMCCSKTQCSDDFCG
jgi:hypothetical protein